MLVHNVGSGQPVEPFILTDEIEFLTDRLCRSHSTSEKNHVGSHPVRVPLIRKIVILETGYRFHRKPGKIPLYVECPLGIFQVTLHRPIKLYLPWMMAINEQVGICFDRKN